MNRTFVSELQSLKGRQKRGRLTQRSSNLFEIILRMVLFKDFISISKEVSFLDISHFIISNIH